MPPRRKAGEGEESPLLPRAGCAGKRVKRPGKSPQAVSNCSNLCDSVCSLKCIQYICAKALFPPHSVNTAPLAPPQSGTEPLLTWVITAQHSPAHPTTKPLNPLCQFLSAWENYSENLKLVTLRDRAWVRPSIQMQTTLFQRRGAVSNIASKCPGPETRAMQPARKRSDRTNPGERAGK